MVLVMRSGVSEKELQETIEQLEKWGHKVSVSRGEKQVIIGVIGDKSDLLGKPLTALPGVIKVLEVSAPYKRASREFHPEDTIIEVDGVKIGGGHKVVIAGPCSVDKLENVVYLAKVAKKHGAKMLRGGAYKPRTSPYSFQGHGEEGLKMLYEAKKETGLPIVTELMSIPDIDVVYKYADVIQIGARNMQNFPLLREVGKLDKPVILKNGIASTVKEHLMAAEYIMSEGNDKVILCLRGTRTYETAVRNTLDVTLVPIMQKMTHLPIIVDPSHAAGRREFVSPLAYAGMAVGADGLIIEIHNCPKKALSDGEQALLPRDFAYLMDKIKKLPAWNQKEWYQFDQQKDTDCIEPDFYNSF
ncbi:MAG: 3-deoxy-7-phosphoheptulonate synthase [Epsilonproteobacteria bacterium]|jgi:3-deoxy-7-phosphoheptulonate synthase|nr:3-deoxy-7-phosphoheptulonate synthase [Campylobacterota bacterium]NPA89072.1 3-deoxy-7-phosphoheptulonate synthase [Campylobacterota bacterium]